MDNLPIAYHITFGTYGTRLHGDPRGTVDRAHNRPGEPIVGADLRRWEREHERLRFAPIELTQEQMIFAESVVPAICTRGRWTHHTSAAGPDHVHVLLTSTADGAAVRKWLKRWLGEVMSSRWPLPPGATWWAECGSVKWVWDDHYFRRASDYVTGQRATRD